VTVGKLAIPSFFDLLKKPTSSKP
jgi:predicted GNAT family acetyltransferase